MELLHTRLSHRRGCKSTVLCPSESRPTSLDVRRLNAIARKLQREPQKLIFEATICSRGCDVHTNSGFMRMAEVAGVKGYGMRGLRLL